MAYRARVVTALQWTCVLGLILATLHVSARADEEPMIHGQDLTGPSGILPLRPDVGTLFEPKVVAGPLEMPWGAAVLPDGRILITERPGRLRIIQNGALLTTPVAGTPQVYAEGHSGLLDVLPDREFRSNRRIFLSYMQGVKGALTMRVMSAVLDGSTLAGQKVIFDSRPAIAGVDQIGGRLAFGPDGLLYLTLGDRFEMHRAQDLRDHSGSIIRIHTDGRIPDDNPFVGRDDALPEIFSYGHRNPQGLAVSHKDGRLWAVEHGPYGGDELNIIEKGVNYGWPLVTYGIDYDGKKIADLSSAPGLADPVYKWVPSVAPSSLVSYSGVLMHEKWGGSFLLGTLSGERFIRLKVEDANVAAEEQMLHHAVGRIRNVFVDLDGAVHLLTDGTSALVYRLDPVRNEVATRRPWRDRQKGVFRRSPRT